jgi:hypothetical protein
MLSSTRLGKHFGLVHVFGKQSFSYTMINLVRTCMIQVLSFQEDARSTDLF